MARRRIKKVAVTPIPEITGSIVNGTNFVDKEHNTYSAEIIDGLVIVNDSGWVDIPKNYASHTPVACRKIDEMVELNVRFYLSETTISVPAWQSVALGTIPEGYRPTLVIEIPIVCKDSNNAVITSCIATINTDGVFFISNITPNNVNNVAVIAFHTMYFTE